MAYSIKFDEDRVLPYLRNQCHLSREGRIKLFSLIHSDLKEHADIYRQDDERRLAHGSPHFNVDYVFSDAGKLKTLWLVVNDSKAVYGVLEVDYCKLF